MAKLVVMYPKPKDPKHFKEFYREVHIPLVEKMPGIKDYSYGYPSGRDGNEVPFFCFFVATFDNVEAIKQAFASPAGEDVVADIPNYSPDHHPTMLFLESTDEVTDPPQQHRASD